LGEMTKVYVVNLSARRIDFIKCVYEIPPDEQANPSHPKKQAEDG